MPSLKVIHFKKDCISCGACAAIAPQFWELEPSGLAHLKSAKEVGDHWELPIEEKDRTAHQDAADVCPVNIIHVKEVKEGEGDEKDAENKE
ncbi:MAG TPA: ferredoxin [Candidatus Nanoarchaeia archaeon]|nr:ferredoxin [Candidatus Nanoarchaeia archaeon]